MLFSPGIVKRKIYWGSTKADNYAGVMIVGLIDSKISSHNDVTEFPQQNWVHLHVSISRLQRPMHGFSHVTARLQDHVILGSTML